MSLKQKKIRNVVIAFQTNKFVLKIYEKNRVKKTS